MKLAYIESHIKNYNIQQLETGDLVKLEADVLPIIFHYGIIDRVGEDVFIYHNQYSFLNKVGGSIIREDFIKYAKGRKIVSIEKTGLNKADLYGIVNILKDKKYDFVDNNCEHFVNKFKNNKFTSPTTKKISIAIVGITALIVLMSRIKK